MGKFDPLRDHLAGSADVAVTLSFPAIERILGETLPSSASKYQAWWANEEAGTHSHARAWLEAGYRTRNLDLATICGTGDGDRVLAPRPSQAGAVARSGMFTDEHVRAAWEYLRSQDWVVRGPAPA